MDLDILRSEMVRDTRRIRAVVEGLAVDQARWKLNPDSWSILEAVNHLADKEELDLRVRLKIPLPGRRKSGPQSTLKAGSPSGITITATSTSTNH